MYSSVRSASIEGSILFCDMRILCLSSSRLMASSSIEESEWSELGAPALGGVVGLDDLRKLICLFALFSDQAGIF